MRTRLISLITLLPLCTVAQSLTIQQLINQLEQSLRYQQYVLQTRIKQEELNQVRATRIPVFYADANLQRNLIIPTTPVPAIAFDPNAAEGAILPLKFATRWSSRAGVQMEWSLFDPKRLLSEQEQMLRIRQAEIETNRQATEWKHAAILAYTAVVLATHQYELALRDSANYAEILTVSAARYEEGRESAPSHYAAQQEFTRRQLHVHEAWSVLLDADLELRKYTDLSSTVTLSTDVDNILVYAGALQPENHELLLLEVDREIINAQLQGLRRQLLPSITLNAYWGQQYFENNFRPFHRNAWFGNSYVSLAFSVPLSEYLSARPTLRKAQLQQLLADKQAEEERQSDRINRDQRIVKIRAARTKVETLQRIAELALRTKNHQEEAYLAGRLLLSDYNLAATAYHQARRDVWQAQYDLIALLVE